MNIKELILKEFCNLIDEARSHPELNKKESVYEQIKKYIDSGKEYYISFTSIDKIGINPRSRYNTPIGIYTYPLREIYESYENTNSDWDKNTNIQVPFPPKNRWKNIYVLEKNPNGKYIDVSEYSSKDYDNDRESLVAEFGEQVIRNCESDMHSKAKYKSPGGYFWYVTYMLCKPYDNVPVRWNKILRKVLGYDGITDKDGYGIIHNAEPIQAVFFTAKSFKVVDKIEYKETMSNDDLFKKHLKHNKIAIIKNMINKDMVDPSADENFAIRYASDNGHHEVVEFLLQDERVDPSAENNYAIRRASENGHLEIVKLLLQDKRVDPSVRNNHAIRFASENGHLEVVKLLLQDERVKNSLSKEQIEEYEKQIGLKEFKQFNESPHIKINNFIFDLELEKIKDVFEFVNYFKKLFSGKIMKDKYNNTISLKSKEDRKQFLNDLLDNEVFKNFIHKILSKFDVKDFYNFFNDFINLEDSEMYKHNDKFSIEEANFLNEEFFDKKIDLKDIKFNLSELNISSYPEYRKSILEKLYDIYLTKNKKCLNENRRMKLKTTFKSLVNSYGVKNFNNWITI